MKCFAEESLIKAIKQLRPNDPEFSARFDELAKSLKEHIRLGHHSSTTRRKRRNRQ